MKNANVKYMHCCEMKEGERRREGEVFPNCKVLKKVIPIFSSLEKRSTTTTFS